MDFEKQLVDSSRFIANLVAKNVGTDRDKFAQLMQLAFSPNISLAMRASRAAIFCLEKDKDLFVPYIKKIIQNLAHNDKSVNKNFLNIFVNYQFSIPEKLMSKLLDYCYEHLMNIREIPSIRVYSMYILYNFSQQETDFKKELVHVFEEAMIDGSAGVKSVGGKLLKKLRKEILSL